MEAGFTNTIAYLKARLDSFECNTNTCPQG
jgi:hypothetical protein